MQSTWIATRSISELWPDANWCVASAPIFQGLVPAVPCAVPAVTLGKLSNWSNLFTPQRESVELERKRAILYDLSPMRDFVKAGIKYERMIARHTL